MSDRIMARPWPCERLRKDSHSAGEWSSSTCPTVHRNPASATWCSFPCTCPRPSGAPPPSPSLPLLGQAQIVTADCPVTSYLQHAYCRCGDHALWQNSCAQCVVVFHRRARVARAGPQTPNPTVSGSCITAKPPFHIVGFLLSDRFYKAPGQCCQDVLLPHSHATFALPKGQAGRALISSSSRVAVCREPRRVPNLLKPLHKQLPPSPPTSPRPQDKSPVLS